MSVKKRMDVGKDKVYPRESQIINTAPIRWFWVVPSEDLPPEFDLRHEG